MWVKCPIAVRAVRQANVASLHARKKLIPNDPPLSIMHPVADRVPMRWYICFFPSD